MVPTGMSASRPRSERRISVRLPMRVRGRDSRGVAFEEETSSENLCRSGAAFLTRFDVAIGSDLEIRIPFSYYASRRYEADFATSGRVVHVKDAKPEGCQEPDSSLRCPWAGSSLACNLLGRVSSACFARNLFLRYPARSNNVWK